MSLVAPAQQLARGAEPAAGQLQRIRKKRRKETTERTPGEGQKGNTCKHYITKKDILNRQTE